MKIKKDWSKILILGEFNKFKSKDRLIKKIYKANALKEILNSKKKNKYQNKKTPN